MKGLYTGNWNNLFKNGCKEFISKCSKQNVHGALQIKLEKVFFWRKKIFAVLFFRTSLYIPIF